MKSSYEIKEPNILLIDSENLPNKIFAWQPGKQYVTPESILKERVIACISAKFLNNDKMYRYKMDLDKYDPNAYDDDSDKEMLVKFSELAEKANLLVAHNGKRHDIGLINSRLIKHQLPPLPIIPMDDTLLIINGVKFNSKKLAYLSKYLDIGEKRDHDISDWLDIVYKNKNAKKALSRLQNYCDGDVVDLLEPFYKRIKPYIKSKINYSIIQENPDICPSCGSFNIKLRGFLYTTLAKKQRYHCNSCNKSFGSGENLIKTPAKYPRSV